MTTQAPTTQEGDGASNHHAEHQVGRVSYRRTLVIVFGLVVIAALGAFLAVVLLSDRSQEASEPPGVHSFENLSRTHTYNRVTYDQNPPVGGDHDPVWQNAGFYEEPVQNEKAVHAMEQGEVWISPTLLSCLRTRKTSCARSWRVRTAC
jgi:Protein of unknown function (DUF3105)